MPFRPFFLCLFTLLVPGAPSRLSAQEPPKTLTVYVKPAKPFAMDRDGQLSGYSVDLWNRIASENSLRFELKVVDSVPKLIEGLSSGQADVGFGALSMTSEREKLIDFSYPVYNSGLQIMVATTEGNSFLVAARAVASDGLKVIGILLIALLINSHVLWFMERHQNPDNFPKSYARGIFEAAWWSTSTLITGGCENLAPRGVAGRLFAVVWMLTGISLVSFVTARMASIMTTKALAGDVRDWKQLSGRRVGTVKDSAANDFLRENGIGTLGFDAIEAACEKLDAGELDAVVYDEPILRYYLTEHPEAKLRLVGERFAKQDYGFGLRQDSPLRKEINSVILRLHEQGYFDQLSAKWFPAKAE